MIAAPSTVVRPQHQTRIAHRRLSLETALYLLIFVLAVLTRFWDLGSRALHHDESLHTYFSWIYAEGYGYVHHPLMHGPALFHANALMYLLFGASDTVSRLVPAGLGVLVVMLPWLLRGETLFGRWGALSASALLLISPSILYYSRFIRHDIFALAGTLTLFVAIARYIERPAPRWALLGLLTTGYLLTVTELNFIVLFVFTLILLVAIVYRVAPVLFAVAAVASAAFLVVSRLLTDPLPPIPWEQPTQANIRRFAEELITHPLSIATLVILGLASAASVWLLHRRADGIGWRDGLLGDAPEGSAAAALRWLLADRLSLVVGIGLSALLFIALYTSLFTNLWGIASGTVGAVGYWLGQQNVERAEQPWFYYLLLLPQYEFIAVLLFPLGVGWQLLRYLRLRRAGLAPIQRDFLRSFLICWTVGMLAILSWAGEKMPWIVVHLTLPLTLFAATFVGDAIAWLEWRRRLDSPPDGRRSLWLAAAALAVLFAAFLVLAWASAGPYQSVDGLLRRTIRPDLAGWRWLVVYLPWLGLIALVVLGAWRLGVRRSLLTVGLAGLVACSLAQVHASWRLTYREGDVPRDMLIYVQTAPDVPRLVEQLRRFSQQQTGGMGLEVWYDNHFDGAQWPLNWYLRDFWNRRFFGGELPSDINAPVVIISDGFRTPEIERALSDYSYQAYPLRWWYPEEETYRRFAYAPELTSEWRQNYQDDSEPPYGLVDVGRSVLSTLWSLREPEQQAEVFRAVAFREMPAPIGSAGFRVYIRNDLLTAFNGVRYSSSID